MIAPQTSSAPAPYWHPVVAGVALGLVLLLTFVWTHHGLGASGGATDLLASLGWWLAPEATVSHGYLGPLVKEGPPIASWMMWELLGLVLGAAWSARLAGRFRLQVDGQFSVGTRRRLISALGGGFLAGLGARVAGGCTSGLGLSGAATLGIAAFVFLALFFVVGLVVSRLYRGV